MEKWFVRAGIVYYVKTDCLVGSGKHKMEVMNLVGWLRGMNSNIEYMQLFR